MIDYILPLFLSTQNFQKTCLPHYPTTVTNDKICIPPPAPDLDCKDIKVAVIVKDVGDDNPDPHDLDSDKDGVGCESYKNKLKSEASLKLPTPTSTKTISITSQIFEIRSTKLAQAYP